MTTIDSKSLLAMRSAILEQNSALQRAAGAGVGAAQPGGASGADATDFSAALKTALQQVNAAQSESAAASESFERGETTDIAAVMLSRQKASIGFEATLQVRNKLLTAYKDIMSMPV